jgi:hypothetical protein
MAGRQRNSQLTTEQANLLYSIGSSNSRQLNRIYNYCSVREPENLLNCIFNIPAPPKVTYYNTKSINIPEGVSCWQGMAVGINNQLIISGTTGTDPLRGQGLIYFGNIDCISNSETSYCIFSVPDAQYTSAYGPRYDPATQLYTFVGSYTNKDDPNTYGFLYRGTTSQADLTNPAKYIRKMNYLGLSSFPITFTHSTYGNFAVGNSGQFNKLATSSWLYNITTGSYSPIAYPGAVSTTTYGIVQNPNGTYTIAGGYTLDSDAQYLESGFIVDMTQTGSNPPVFSNWSNFKFPDLPFTHFEGISLTSDPNVYTLAGDSRNSSGAIVGFAVVASRVNGQFIVNSIVSINYGESISAPYDTTSNSIQNNNVVGILTGTNPTIAYQATVNRWY